MNLSKKLLSAGLATSVLFSGITCSCAEPEHAPAPKPTADSGQTQTTKQPSKATSNLATRLAWYMAAYCVVSEVQRRFAVYERDAARHERDVARHERDAARHERDAARRREINVARPADGNVNNVENSDMGVYISQLRLTNAMLKKANDKGNVAAHRNLELCRKYLIAKLNECAILAVHRSADETARLQRLEERINALRHELYVFDENGNITSGADLDEPRDDLVQCSFSLMYYLPVDIQYCGFINTDGDNVTVHGVSTQAVTDWVRGGNPNNVCTICHQAAHYVAPGQHNNDAHNNGVHYEENDARRIWEFFVGG